MRLTAPLPRLAAVAFTLAVPGAAAAQNAAGAASEARLQEDVERSGAPGIAVAVVRGDGVVSVRGFGSASVESGTPVTPETLFQIGSATKMLTAAAVMSAHAAKVLDVDAPVSRYVSGLAACVGAPTVRQLLSHTGGLIDEPDEFGPQGEEGLAAYPRTWTTEYCLLPPGRAFSYSNSGFALAGLALQEAEKKPFADVVKARVLEPLGMTRTTFRPTEAMTWPLAVGHRRDPAGKFTAVRPLPNDARLWPAGTVYSSAQEMARLVVALLNDGRVEGRQALPAGLAATLRTAVADIPTTGERYGLGQFLTERTFGHGGTMTGSAAQVTIDRSAGVGVVVLSNGDNAALTPIAQTLLRNAGVTAAPAPAPPGAAGWRRPRPAAIRRHLSQPAPLHGGSRAERQRPGAAPVRPRLPASPGGHRHIRHRPAARRHRDDRVRRRNRRPRRLPADERLGARPGSHGGQLRATTSRSLAFVRRERVAARGERTSCLLFLSMGRRALPLRRVFDTVSRARRHGLRAVENRHDDSIRRLRAGELRALRVVDGSLLHKAWNEGRAPIRRVGVPLVFLVAIVLCIYAPDVVGRNVTWRRRPWRSALRRPALEQAAAPA